MNLESEAYDFKLSNHDTYDYCIFHKSNILLTDRIIKIMIIDDSSESIQLFDDLLTHESDLKYALIKNTNSYNALSSLEVGVAKPDLIVLDLVMPCMHGKLVLKSIREIASARAIPVVIYSSMNNEDNVKRVGDLGASAFFAKPLNVKSFMAFLKDI